MHSALRAFGAALACMTACAAASATSLGERSSETLLGALEERRMHDVVLWVIDRALADPAASREFTAGLPVRRAAALEGASRTEGDPARRAAMLDEAVTCLDGFLAGGPTGDPAIAAWLQKGRLLADRGRAKLDQSRRPGRDAAADVSDGVALLDAAVACLSGTAAPRGTDGGTTGAEDAILRELRAVDARIAGIRGGAKGGAAAPARLTPQIRRDLERLEDLRKTYRARLMSTRLLVGTTLAEKARAYPPDAPQAAAALAESTAVFRGMAEKHGGTAAGAHARVAWGRNLAAEGRFEEASETLAPLLALDGTSPVAVSLRAKGLRTSLECWLALAASEREPARARRILERFDDGLRRFALTPSERLPGRGIDPEWLAVRYRAATALESLAGSMEPKERQRGAALRRDARTLAIAVALANKDFAREARELASRLGRDVPEADGGEQDVAALLAEARVRVAALQDGRAAAERLRDEGREDEAADLLASAAGDREAAIEAVERAIAAGRSDPQADESALNTARSLAAFLYFDAGRFAEAADVGTLLVERHPNAGGSRQAARAALASLQRLAAATDPEVARTAGDRLLQVARAMLKIWPADREGADAAAVLLDAAIESRDVTAIVQLLAAIPPSSPRRAELVLAAGAALRREVQDARRRQPGERPDDATLETWNAAAGRAVDEGLASLEATGSLPRGHAARVALSAALARMHMALEEGDRATAAGILEHPVYGPWTAVVGGNPDAAQGPLAEASLTVALRLFAEAEEVDKARHALDALEKTEVGPDSATRRASTYLALARDLRTRLDRLAEAAGAGDAGARDRAARLRPVVEGLLEAVARRDPRIASQLWVAGTYLSLGSDASARAVVPASASERCLDRAAEIYGAMLSGHDEASATGPGRAELAPLEPSIRLKLATILGQRGRWADAQRQLDSMLADPKLQASLDLQVRAAEVLESSGRAAAAAGNEQLAESLLRSAAAGRSEPPVVIWGWQGIANRLSRKGLASGDAASGRTRELFFEARLHVAQTLLARSRLGGSSAERARRLATAHAAVAMTRKLYPDLGGEASRARFEGVLREIQREQGAARPGGFADLDAEAAAAATP